LRNYFVRQSTCCFTHATREARSTKAPLLARERDQPVIFARLAINSSETVGKNSTAQKRLKFSPHEFWDTMTALLALPKKGRKVFGHDLVEQALFRAVSLVVVGADGTFRAVHRWDL